MDNFLDPVEGKIPLPRPDPRLLLPSEPKETYDQRPFTQRVIAPLAKDEKYSKGAIHPLGLLEHLGYNVSPYSMGDPMQIEPWDVMQKRFRYQTQGL